MSKKYKKSPNKFSLIFIFLSSVYSWAIYKWQKIWQNLKDGAENVSGPAIKTGEHSKLELIIKLIPETLLILLIFFSVTFSKYSLPTLPKLEKIFQDNAPQALVVRLANTKPTNTNIITAQNSAVENVGDWILNTKSVSRSPDKVQELIFSKIVDHTVAKNETIASISSYYNLKTETVMWTNNLASEVLTEGQVLKILPVDGILIQFTENSSLRDISRRYQGKLDQIMSYNGFLEEDEIDAGQILICPNCKLPKPNLSVTNPSSENKQKVVQVGNLQVLDDALFDGSGTDHIFTPGQCTWFVAKHFPVKWSGHAKYWVSNARRAGYEIGEMPEVGAVVGMNSNNRYGHVALIVDIADHQIKIREMNYNKPYQITERWISTTNPNIQGFIYRPSPFQN